MTPTTRRETIKWFASQLVLAPLAAIPKTLETQPRSVGSVAERCDALFSSFLPGQARNLISLEKAGIFAAVYESSASSDDGWHDRWLCLAVKKTSKDIEVQVSRDVLLQVLPNWHPVDVSMDLSGNFVEVIEEKLRGSVSQRWGWDGRQWLLSEKKSADVSLGQFTVEEYNASQAKVMVASGRIDQSDFEFVKHYQGSTQVALSSYGGESLAVELQLASVAPREDHKG